jgi:hypothetical protein
MSSPITRDEMVELTMEELFTKLAKIKIHNIYFNF